MTKINSNNRNSSNEDLYALLNLSRLATPADIQRSYKVSTYYHHDELFPPFFLMIGLKSRSKLTYATILYIQRLSRVFHPDKSPLQTEHAQTTFVAIKHAHDVLMDPILRLAYDYGGLPAVALIKRSQSHSKKGASSDLYTELQRTTTKEDAISLLQQILDKDKLTSQQQQQQHSSETATTDLSTHVTFPHEYGWMQKPEPASTAVQFQSRLRKGDQWSWTVGGNASIQHTAMVDTSTTLSVDYQPQRGTHVTVDSSFRPGQSWPNVSCRSSRQMANGTFLITGLAGNGPSVNNWTYSVVSYRNLLWEGRGEESTPKKLQASWRMSFKPASGKFQQAIATIKTREFPQWRCSAGLGAFPIKLSYQSAEHNSPYIAYSWGVNFSKIKLAWIQRTGGGELGDWTFKYGVKLDGRALYQPGVLSLWTVIFQLYSNNWTIRIPISLFKKEAWPVASILTLLASQWCDQLLEDVWARLEEEKSPAGGYDWNKGKNFSQETPFERFSGMIELIAAKKKFAEENAMEGGLVILSGWWEPERGVSFGSTKNAVDVTSFLQYWVVDGKLLLPMAEVTQWLPRIGSTDEQTTKTWGWKNVWTSFQRNFHHSNEDKEGIDHSSLAILRIRYKFRQKVYDIQFSEAEDRKVFLPNDERASELGLADQVH